MSDLPIRVVDVGGYKVGVYGVSRPKAVVGGANLHEMKIAEIYYMLSGAATLVTGGTMTPPTRSTPGPPSLRFIAVSVRSEIVREIKTSAVRQDDSEH